jgi:hypothetical protein
VPPLFACFFRLSPLFGSVIVTRGVAVTVHNAVATVGICFVANFRQRTTVAGSRISAGYTTSSIGGAGTERAAESASAAGSTGRIKSCVSDVGTGGTVGQRDVAGIASDSTISTVDAVATSSTDCTGLVTTGTADTARTACATAGVNEVGTEVDGSGSR